MEIKFRNVKIRNFFSIGDAELNLSNNGYVFIEGINNFTEDNARANGVGKTALLDSIIWNLTGETSRGTKDVVNKYAQGGTRVELEFDIE